MKIAILTCEKLPDLNPEDQNIITELAKHNIDAKPLFGTIKPLTDFDYLIFEILGIISRKKPNLKFGSTIKNWESKHSILSQ
jgi:hypothetical protein